MTSKAWNIILVLLLLCLMTAAVSAQQSTTGPTPPPGTDRGLRPHYRSHIVIPDVPAYIWQHGCGPTAAGMVIGYWDLNGPHELVPGEATTQTAAVNAMIADDSQNPSCGLPILDHYQDYACPIDASPTLLTDKSQGGPTHQDDCVADFMRTSRSLYGNYYGWSWMSEVPTAYLQYVDMKVPGLNPEATNYYFWEFGWEQYKEEIDQCRPVVLLVDTDGDAVTDHFVTGIGYDETTMEYGIHDTWDNGIHWYTWQQMANGQRWGVFGITTFRNMVWTRPFYVLDSSKFLDIDGDVFCDPGDTVKFYFFIRNIGMVASNATITMTSNDPNVVFPAGSISRPYIYGEGASTDNLGEPLAYIVPEVENPGFDSFYVTIESDGGAFQKIFRFEQQVGHTRILIVDDDRGDSYENTYLGDLYVKRVPAHMYDKMTAGSPSGADLMPYSAVFWFTGDTAADLLQPNDIAAMKNYLDNGGNLFLSGQCLASELQSEDPFFLENYLHASSADPFYNIIHEGLAGSPIGDGLKVRYYGSCNQEFSLSRQIQAISPALAEFRFKNGGTSAVSYEGSYKVAFFNWGYEAITNEFGAYNRRDTVMTRILLFLDGWTVPPCFDSDGDGYGDPGHPENICATDNCPAVYNPDQTDADSNGIGDACEFMCGDADNNKSVNILDVAYIISYLYKGGPAPVSETAADADGNGAINILDVAWLINYLYKGGPAPDCR